MAAAKAKAKRTRKPPVNVKRTIDVKVELKGTGCYGGSSIVYIEKKDGKIAVESDGGSFKCNWTDLQEAVKLLGEDVQIVSNTTK